MALSLFLDPDTIGFGHSRSHSFPNAFSIQRMYIHAAGLNVLQGCSLVGGLFRLSTPFHWKPRQLFTQIDQRQHRKKSCWLIHFLENLKYFLFPPVTFPPCFLLGLISKKKRWKRMEAQANKGNIKLNYALVGLCISIGLGFLFMSLFASSSLSFSSYHWSSFSLSRLTKKPLLSRVLRSKVALYAIYAMFFFLRPPFPKN